MQDAGQVREDAILRGRISIVYAMSNHFLFLPFCRSLRCRFRHSLHDRVVARLPADGSSYFRCGWGHPA